ncbi:MAG: transporter substrate-binding domain-containing protein [Crocosphaera sp.]
MFQVFVLTDVLIDRLSNVLAAVHLFTVGIVTTAALFGFLQIRWKRLRNLLISGLILAVIALFSTKIYLTNSLAEYDKDKIIANMQLLQPSVSSVIVEPAKNPIPLKPNQSLLNRVQQRGVIRIGYLPDNLPFSYTNAQGKLVGFDIDMAQRLAQELNVTVEFVPFKLDNLNRVLNEDYFDLGMSGILGTVQRSYEEIRFSDPYLNVTMALVVPDYRDKEFTDLASINRRESLKIGITDKRLFGDKIKLYLPNAEVVFLDSPRDFFEKKNKGKDADVLLSSAEAGAAWTLLYPRFQVVNPLPRQVAIPLVYPFNGHNDAKMDEFIDHWVELKKLDGTISEVYDYWILGKGSEKKEPRWSIIHNVLGWI